MARYRKKPIEVEAIQFTEDNVAEVLDWCRRQAGDAVPQAWEDKVFGSSLAVHAPLIGMRTAHGGVAMAEPGGWLIPDAKPGTFYPVLADVFATTYEAVES